MTLAWFFGSWATHTKLLRDGGAPDHGSRYVLVFLYYIAVRCLAHVKVDPETDGDDVREQKDEPHQVSVPGTIESLST